MFRVVEDKLGPVIGKIAANSKQKGIHLEKEITKNSAAINGSNCTVVNEKVGICVASDTHWPRHHGSGGKKYVSPSSLT
eukprot:scaffold16571_cov76-Attheya_sp.AAC.3